MSDRDLLCLAARAGLETRWCDAEGEARVVSPEVLRAVLAILGMPAASDALCRESEAALLHESEAELSPLLVVRAGEDVGLSGGTGRWRVSLEGGGAIEGDAAEDGTCTGTRALPLGYHRVEKGRASQMIAVVPDRAFGIDEAGSGRCLAGLAAQLYGLRRAGGDEIGDFLALERLARRAAAHGMDALAISPVHALSLATPRRFSPYSPSSRTALNPAYAPWDTEGSHEGGGGGALIDWPAAIARRLGSARRAFAADVARPRFVSFAAAVDPDLLHYALFEAIAAHEVARGGSADWRCWPAELRDPDGAAAREFAARHATEVRFHLYLQYRACVGLADAGHAAREGGMAIGLITDLAVGVDPGGADAWGRQAEMLRGASIGAPPDFLSRAGQRWGLTSFSPRGLRRSGFAGFLAVLRAALRDAGGVRIDHALGLTRLWIVPDGAPASEGVYLRYPFDALSGLIALESRRHRGIVLAEDLGTVPAGFSDRLARRGMAGLNVLWLERDAEGFRLPAAWRKDAAAMTSTHDMPTVVGWWRGRDIAWRSELGLAGPRAEQRERDRHLLWRAFLAQGTASGCEPAREDAHRVARAAAAFLGRAASRLALLPLEDALGLTEQPNIPGTIDQHPNWRRRMPEPVETMLERPEVAGRLAAFLAARVSQ